MDTGGVFDDRKSKSRASHFLGVALVDAVKSFKHAVLIFGRDADNCIPHRQYGAAVIFSDDYGNAAAFVVIFYRVITKVVNDPVDQLRYSFCLLYTS